MQKADNFFVLNDSSSSMAENYPGAGYPAHPSPTKFSVEKEILNRINLTIPDLKLTSSIRSLASALVWTGNLPSLTFLRSATQKSPFGSGIDTLTCASGGTPLDSGIEETTKDLSTTTGNIAVLILSDGEIEHDPVSAVQSLKQRYGDRLCVYTVWVGNEKDEHGQTTIKSTFRHSRLRLWHHR